ncbi:sel1 repeat family protein [Burkholderia cepacia]|uniref:SEL1-like repeat protein n=1 Tax=Burkholderia cepacia TaxID=292 RepID=UPI001E632DFD|nr:sel1 repeat family protein [Burkholderia cepacia]
MMKKFLIVVAALTLCACTKKDNSVASSPDMGAVRANLAFTCIHQADRLPPLDPKADNLFRYARYLEKKDGPKDYDDVARYYRIAAAHGHYKANQNLQSLLSEGLANSPDPRSESVDLAMSLVKQNIPSGYYSVGHYLEIGYGLKQDSEAALRYFRKAADLGNPEAQYYIGDKLLPNDNAPDVARQMLACAADQGFGQAASLLGVDRMAAQSYSDAIAEFQKGVAAGDSQSASFLEKGFRGPPESNKLYYLGLANDPERSRRYELIGEFIDRNDGRNPRVPEIDKIVPLPPAKLPAWDGTFQWQKEQDVAVPPQKPSDEMINEMARAQNLDPKTGLPLERKAKQISQQEQSQNVAARLPLGAVARTGQQCPEDGVWCAKLEAGQVGDVERRFLKGDVLPSVVVHEPRRLAVLDSMLGTRQRMAPVSWELVAYLDQS